MRCLLAFLSLTAVCSAQSIKDYDFGAALDKKSRVSVLAPTHDDEPVVESHLSRRMLKYILDNRTKLGVNLQ